MGSGTWGWGGCLQHPRLARCDARGQVAPTQLTSWQRDSLLPVLQFPHCKWLPVTDCPSQAAV